MRTLFLALVCLLPLSCKSQPVAPAEAAPDASVEPPVADAHTEANAEADGGEDAGLACVPPVDGAGGN